MGFRYQCVLITGGAGFVGSNLAVWLMSRHPGTTVIVADNLKRRGSELNLTRLREHGVEFTHCDVRNPEDLHFEERAVDLIIDCSAEPSVLAGYAGSAYVVNTNLVGTVNCLELARRVQADLVFLSTSRVYPIGGLNAVKTVETDTRFTALAKQDLPGASDQGINEGFPMDGRRSLYGATKLCSELLIQEYAGMYGLRYLIDRCGILAGPWQMGKVDQGVFALWVMQHHFNRDVTYIGWGGTGKQVRDLLHVDDLAELIDMQLSNPDAPWGQVFNVGGGAQSSLSLQEATRLCQEITGRRVAIAGKPHTHPDDVRWYVSDIAKVTTATGWRPRHTPAQILESIHQWVCGYESSLRELWPR